MILDCLLDALNDGVHLLPFLFVTYLIMEFLEKREGERLQAIIKQAGKTGPVWGALLGVIPQCGFSAMASSMYAGRVIAPGTLLAVYMSTSDEMLPILLSQSSFAASAIKIILAKVLIAIASGYALGAVFRKIMPVENEHMDIHTICEHEHCDCHDGILKSAVKHTVKILLFVLSFSVVLNIVIELIGEDCITTLFSSGRGAVLAVVLCALIGLIPNCASSVIITQMYIKGIISVGAMMSGLLVGAGVGLLILIRLLPKKKEAFTIVLVLLSSGVLWGLIIELIMRL